MTAATGEGLTALSNTRAGWIVLLPVILLAVAAQTTLSWAHGDEEPPPPHASVHGEVVHLKEELLRMPDSLPLQIRLARAYIVEGRDNGTHASFARAEKILDRVLKKAPEEKEALYLRAWAAMFRHCFTEAAAWAMKGIERYPDAGIFYGILSDSNLERGNMKNAVVLAQKMLDLKPDQGSYSRAAHLRSVYGDSEGAVELWQMAIRAGSADRVDTAWCYVELGNEHLKQGDAGKAEQAYRAASALVPGYPKAEAGLTKVRKAAAARVPGREKRCGGSP